MASLLASLDRHLPKVMVCRSDRTWPVVVSFLGDVAVATLTSLTINLLAQASPPTVLRIPLTLEWPPLHLLLNRHSFVGQPTQVAAPVAVPWHTPLPSHWGVRLRNRITSSTQQATALEDGKPVESLPMVSTSLLIARLTCPAPLAILTLRWQQQSKAPPSPSTIALRWVVRQGK